MSETNDNIPERYRIAPPVTTKPASFSDKFVIVTLSVSILSAFTSTWRLFAATALVSVVFTIIAVGNEIRDTVHELKEGR